MNKRQTALIEQDFYSVLLHIQLTGAHVDETVTELTSVSRATWYRRKTSHPTVFQAALERATSTAISLRQAMQEQVLQQRITAELQAQTVIVRSAVGIVNRVVDIATSKDVQPQHSVAAARTLSSWGKTGMLVPMAAEETAKEAEEMGYDPNMGIDPSMLSLPPGSRVTIETPEIVDVPIGTS